MTRLFIGNVSKRISRSRIEQELNALGRFVNLVVIKKNPKSFQLIFFDVENDSSAQKFLAQPLKIDGREHYIQVSHKSQAQESTLNVHRVFLSNIPLKMSDNELRSFFTRKFGEVVSAFSIKSNSGKSKGYGFIDFKSKQVANQVVKVKKIAIQGKLMIAKEFKQRSKGSKKEST
jgi:polyadenylate-binding protein